MMKITRRLYVEVLVKNLEGLGSIDSYERDYLLDNMDSIPCVLCYEDGEWSWRNVGTETDQVYVIDTFDGKTWTETDVYPVECGKKMYFFVSEY